MENTLLAYKRRQLLKNSIWNEKEADNSTWVLSLSDLMSLLLIFFLVWTTIKISATTDYQSYGKQITQSAKKNATELKGLLMDFDPIENSNNIMVVLDGEVLFKTGSNKITEQGQALLFRISKLLKKNPRFNLRVIGHTDNVAVKKGGKWRSNLELSLARGAAVAASLIELGIPSNKIFVQGEGEEYPKVENLDDIHRTFNRRVELIIEPY